MTNARTLRGARFRSNFFSKKCRCSQSQAIQGSDVLVSVAYLNQVSAGQASHCESNANIRGYRIRFNRLDSTGAYESSLAKLLEAKPIR